MKLIFFVAAVLGLRSANASTDTPSFFESLKSAIDEGQKRIDVSSHDKFVSVPAYSVFDWLELVQVNECIGDYEEVQEGHVYIDISGCNIIDIPDGEDLLMAQNVIDPELRLL